MKLEITIRDKLTWTYRMSSFLQLLSSSQRYYCCHINYGALQAPFISIYPILIDKLIAGGLCKQPQLNIPRDWNLP